MDSKPLIPNHPFAFLSEAVQNKFDLCTDQLDAFLDGSMYWFIGATIEDTVLGAIELVEDSKLNKSKLHEIGWVLRNLNTVYSTPKTDVQTFIGHRFFLLAVYKYPDYSAVVALILHYFLATMRDKSAAYAIISKIIDEVNLILRRTTKEDVVLATYEAEHLLLKSDDNSSEAGLTQLTRRLRLQRLMVRTRILNAATFLGFIFLNKLISEEDFNVVFIKLRDSVKDAYKFEALCQFVLISGQYIADLSTNAGTTYSLVHPKERNIDSVYGISFINLIVHYLKLSLGKHHIRTIRSIGGSKTQDMFRKLNCSVKARTEEMEEEMRKRDEDAAQGRHNDSVLQPQSRSYENVEIVERGVLKLIPMLEACQRL